MNALETLRISISKNILILLWAHVPVIGIVAFLLSANWMVPTIGAVIFAVIPSVVWFKSKGAALYRYLTAVSYMVQVALLVYAFAGHPWQIDIHMYFFAALAIIAALCDWKAVLIAAATVATHHLVLNFVYPYAVFPEGADFWRVVMHAAVVVLETATLIWLTYRLTTSFSNAEESVEQAKEAALLAEGEKNKAFEASRVATAANEEAAAARTEAEKIATEKNELEASSAQREKNNRNEMAQAFEASIAGIVNMVSEKSSALLSLATEMKDASRTVGHKTENTNKVSEQMTDSVQAVSSATEELGTSILEISQQIGRSSTIAQEAAVQAKSTTTTMGELTEAAQQISEVVGLISDIAEQTNLLALNATIEAARAGDAGKGFAVVASEVKNLATQTAKATEDITSKVESIQRVSNQAASEINGIHETVNTISETTTSIASAIEEQTAATGEISGSITRAHESTVQVRSNVSDINESAQKSELSAEELVRQSDALAADTDSLKTEISGFVAKIKAG